MSIMLQLINGFYVAFFLSFLFDAKTSIPKDFESFDNNIMKVSFWTVDVFSHKAFSGNPSCVIFLKEWLEELQMQNIAMEINLPETSFVMPKDHGFFEVKAFNPIMEISFCGNSIVAAAHIIWNEKKISNEELYFESKNGVIKLTREDEMISIDLPCIKTIPLSTPVGLVEALDCTPIFVGNAGDCCFVELDNSEAVFSINPDITRLSNMNFSEIILSANGLKDDPFDVVSRCFFPKTSYVEDSASSLAHTKIGPYWRKRLKKDNLLAFQASKREGFFYLNVTDERVVIKGKAVTVSEGCLYL